MTPIFLASQKLNAVLVQKASSADIVGLLALLYSLSKEARPLKASRALLRTRVGVFDVSLTGRLGSTRRGRLVDPLGFDEKQ